MGYRPTGRAKAVRDTTGPDRLVLYRCAMLPASAALCQVTFVGSPRRPPIQPQDGAVFNSSRATSILPVRCYSTTWSWSCRLTLNATLCWRLVWRAPSDAGTRALLTWRPSWTGIHLPLCLRGRHPLQRAAYQCRPTQTVCELVYTSAIVNSRFARVPQVVTQSQWHCCY